MIYGQPPFYSLSVFQKMKAIPDPNHQIDYPSISVPTIPGPKDASGAGGPPQERREQFATPVPEDVRRLIQSCLQRDPKKRSLIPDLLASPWLNDWSE
jgi:serine/threonine-protein kinase TTK/MPS1